MHKSNQISLKKHEADRAGRTYKRPPSLEISAKKGGVVVRSPDYMSGGDTPEEVMVDHKTVLKRVTRYLKDHAKDCGGEEKKEKE
jgi:hypothetical protein